MSRMTTTDVTEQIHKIASRSRKASRKLASASTNLKNEALEAMSDALLQHEEQILAANAQDLERGRAGGMSEGLLDRLALNSERIADIAAALLDLAGLADPVGEIVRGSTLPNGLRLKQVQVPMGVVGMIYEARPNVTVDAAGLGLKSGNAVILRGGAAAADTNMQVVAILADAVESVGLPRDSVQSIDDYGREGAVALMRARGYVDLVIPRGGAGLIQTVVEQARVPVIETGVGNCHVYVDRDVDQEEALAIVVNSKTHRPSVCNAAEKVLIHEDRVADFLPTLLTALSKEGVQITGDPKVIAAAPASVTVEPLEEDDLACEYLALRVAITVVDSLQSAIDHIGQWSSGHTDAICTTSLDASEKFTTEVDSAVVNVNASTRFTDGGQFGLGAEIGISTQKLHARGPMGLGELTTTKWVVHGQGQIRE